MWLSHCCFYVMRKMAAADCYAPNGAASSQPGAAPWVLSDDKIRPERAKAFLCGNNAFLVVLDLQSNTIEY